MGAPRDLAGLVVGTGRSRGALIGGALALALCAAAAIALRRWWRLRSHEQAVVGLAELDRKIASPETHSIEAEVLVQMRSEAQARVGAATKALADLDKEATAARAAVAAASNLSPSEVQAMLLKAGLALALVLWPGISRAEEPPGARTIWTARPDADGFAALAGWDGPEQTPFVVALSPKRAAWIATEVTSLRERDAASQRLIAEQAEEIRLLKIEVASLSGWRDRAVVAEENERVARRAALTWEVRATAPKGRWVSGLAGFALGVLGGVAVK